MTITFNNIPNEALVHIFDQVKDLETLANSAQVCKLWNFLLNDERSIWHKRIECERQKVSTDYFALSFAPLLQNEATLIFNSDWIRTAIACLKAHTPALADKQLTFFNKLLKEEPTGLVVVNGTLLSHQHIWDELFHRDCTRILLILIKECHFELFNNALDFFNLQFDTQAIFKELIKPFLDDKYVPKCELTTPDAMGLAAKSLGYLIHQKPKLDIDDLDKPNLESVIRASFIGSFLAVKTLTPSDYTTCGLLEWNSDRHIQMMRTLYTTTRDYLCRSKEKTERCIEVFAEGMKQLTLPASVIQFHFKDIQNTHLVYLQPFKDILQAKLSSLK